MELNMNVLENENFRSLLEDAQLLYIYATLKTENGLLENLDEFGDYLMMDVYVAMGVLETHGLIRYYGEHDSIKIIEEPEFFQDGVLIKY